MKKSGFFKVKENKRNPKLFELFINCLCVFFGKNKKGEKKMRQKKVNEKKGKGRAADAK